MLLDNFGRELGTQREQEPSGNVEAKGERAEYD